MEVGWWLVGREGLRIETLTVSSVRGWKMLMHKLFCIQTKLNKK